jgi:hypothetical protein
MAGEPDLDQVKAGGSRYSAGMTRQAGIHLTEPTPAYNGNHRSCVYGGH